MTAFNIKIISDTVCPFCYIGKKRLDRAIATHIASSPADTFTTSFHAYHIDPSASSSSAPEREVMSRRFGAARFASMAEHVRNLGVNENIAFNFEGRVGSTRDSHRLIQLAREKNLEGSVVGEIMKMYFEEGMDITSTNDLVKAGERGGLKAEEARAWLDAGKGGDAVDREIEEAGRMGVRGVPRFVINEQFEVAGAENVEAFLRQFSKVKAAAV